MFELQFGYLHCVGRTVYSAGLAASEEEAQNWVREKQAGGKRSVKPPKEDPIAWCPVKKCHLKFQTPWFTYRPMTLMDDTITYT